MAVIAFASQKGGVGRDPMPSARRRGDPAGLTTIVSDLDAAQGTVHEWAKDRAKLGLEPPITVRLCRTAPKHSTGQGTWTSSWSTVRRRPMWRPLPWRGWPTDRAALRRRTR